MHIHVIITIIQMSSIMVAAQRNLAVEKYVSQSSTYGHNYAYLAVRPPKNNIFYYGCSATDANQLTAWWSLKLPDVVYVTNVQIYYREGFGKVFVMSDPERGKPPEQEVSLRDVMKAVKTQGEFNEKLRKDISELRHEVHGSTVAVASQVKKRPDTSYIRAIDNSKTDYARDTMTEVIDKIKRRNKLVKIADSSEGVGRLLGHMKVIQWPVTPTMRAKLIKLRVGRYVNVMQKEKSLLLRRLIILLLVLLLNLLTLSKQKSAFREPKSWYNGQALYQNQSSTSGYQRQNRQGACYGCGSFQHWRSQCPFNPRPIQPKSK
ncbi:unnamed protein product [Mytilus edulis]|uniref:CCHC-type domain-containing protein n=1 Tax=Mytilus edulis TaxID=6550 RepID=A0A8S3RKX9_MYTED|nr:unnamed protein product [Mytilus edulis]